ncbi:hypothetical protein SAMN05519103_00360 [Rhizobiales bacterium GAS113]|nr:hypothetical protein SAMN05519103_00360 [Rhizobiales bacterium GAS113]
MTQVPVLDSVASKTILMEQIDALFCVTKYPARYSYVTVASPTDTFTITPTGSPFIYTNQTGAKLDVKVQGGTVSKIEHGRKGAFVDTGETQGPVLIASADQVRVTYSVVPTITAFPVI